jgi:N-methylhydantoinase B/oxoprolinase/acetone carboxylase alpha subunit
LSERRVFSAYGLKGGENGLVGKNTLIDSEGIHKNLGGKNTLVVKPFETVKI